MVDRPPLTPERLSELLSRLDDVMAEAARLRGEITKQLNDQRRTDQPNVTTNRRRPAASRGRSKTR